MTFINQNAFLWALAAVPIVLLYLWRLPPRRHAVGTGFLWEQVFSSAGGKSAWWAFRRPVSLGVQLAVLALLVVALAEPHFRPPRRLVIVIDNSASMNATDAEPTRLGEAINRARQQLRAIGVRDQAAIITGGDPLRVACRPTGRLDTLQRALDAVSPTEGPTRVVDAVALARRLLDGSPHGRILVFTDGCFDGAAGLAAQDDVRLSTVGGPGDNLAITSLDARRSLSDPLECQVFVEAASFSDEPAECRVELELDGKPIDPVPIALEADGRWRQVFEMTSAEGGRLTAHLDRPDVLESDNHASVDVPGQPIRQVALVGERNLYLEKALEACTGVDVTPLDAPPARPDEAAVTVLHGHVPTSIPEGPVLVVDPTGPSEFWELGDPVESPMIAKMNESLPPAADGAAVVSAIDRPGGRVLVLSGVLGGSDLTHGSALPTLIGNALEWLVVADDVSVGSSLSASESDVRVPARLASQTEMDVPGSSGPSLSLWLFPTMAALLLAAAEWHLFQRRWTC